MTIRSFIKCITLLLFIGLGVTNQAHTAIPKPSMPKPSWSDVFEHANDKVVQIFPSGNAFNWSQPFKQGDEHKGGSGSGFVTTASGDIYTNFHVIAESDVLEIQHPLVWKEKFDVEFVGGYPEYDLAHLRIKPAELERLKALLPDGKLNYFELADSDNVVQGQEIMLVGYPLGEEHVKPSVGPISGRVPSTYFGGECFTTTAPSNPGNSGGPALNQEGKVIGIAVGVISGADGINYLIPINRLKVVMDELENGAVLEKNFWGFAIEYTTPSTFVYLGNPVDAGAYITRVDQGSLAEQAGIKKGDVLASINGYKVDRFGDMSVPWSASKVFNADFVARIKNGQTVTFGIYRAGELVQCPIVKSQQSPLRIKKYYLPFQQEPSCDVFGGIVFTELTLNHVDELLATVAYFLKQGDFGAIGMLKDVMPIFNNDNRHKPRLIITHKFPETDVAKNHVFGLHDCLLKTVNDIPVYTIQDLQQAVLAKADTGYMVLETEKGTKVALPLQDILAQEASLSKKYRYPLSSLVQELKNAN